MSKKITLCVLAALVFLGFAPWSEAAFQLKKLGTRNAFYQPDLKSEADVKKMLQVNRDAIQQILQLVAWPGNIDDLVRAGDTGTIGTISIAPGTQIPFMAMRRSHRRADVVRNVVWAGNTSFDAYTIEFDSAGSTWRFVFPKICSNFWLEEVPKAAPPPPPPPPEAPAPPPAPAPEAPPPPAVTAPPPAPEGIFFIAGLIGKERRVLADSAGPLLEGHGNCDTILGIKGGVLPRFGEHGEAELALGVKVDLSDDRDVTGRDRATLFIDAALHARFSSGFIGGGVSFWDLTESDYRTASLLAQLGFGHKVGFLIEARAPFEDLDDLSNNYMIWAGIRIRP